MIDPNIYREAANYCLAANREQLVTRQRGMCTAIAQAVGWRARRLGTQPSLQDLLNHEYMLEQYFKPWPANAYWWPDVSEQSQAERFMALHFMALIAEDLE